MDTEEDHLSSGHSIVGHDTMTIPQILAGSAKEIIWACDYLYSKGYPEINLNLGCPSGTVTKKGRGSGLLRDPEILSDILREVFSARTMGGKGVRISVKTRLGLTEPEEFYKILPVLNSFPICEIIIHPRVGSQGYGGLPHLDIFEWAMSNSAHPIAYNGDIKTIKDLDVITSRYPSVKHIMIGRGIISNPALAREWCGGPSLQVGELRTFIQAITESYRGKGTSEKQVLCKLKELWSYWSALFIDTNGDLPKLLHKLYLSKNMTDYSNAERQILSIQFCANHGQPASNDL